MERVLSRHMTASISNGLDQLQFTYKSKRDTDNTTVSLLTTITKHLQVPIHYVRIIFIDFTSGFNTMQIHILLQRLINLGVNGGITHWIRDSLSDRPQRGAIFSPCLFSVYTNEFNIDHAYFSLFKYADDMALVALLQEGDTERENLYFNHALTFKIGVQPAP